MVSGEKQRPSNALSGLTGQAMCVLGCRPRVAGELNGHKRTTHHGTAHYGTAHYSTTYYGSLHVLTMVLLTMALLTVALPATMPAAPKWSILQRERSAGARHLFGVFLLSPEGGVPAQPRAHSAAWQAQPRWASSRVGAKTQDPQTQDPQTGAPQGQDLQGWDLHRGAARCHPRRSSH